MAEPIELNGVTYTARAVTLEDITIDSLLASGSLDQRLVLKHGIVRTDGQAIDWATIPIGHAMRLLPLALEAAGFEVGAPATGNA